jgi:hypothetical protein
LEEHLTYATITPQSIDWQPIWTDQYSVAQVYVPADDVKEDWLRVDVAGQQSLYLEGENAWLHAQQLALAAECDA